LRDLPGAGAGTGAVAGARICEPVLRGHDARANVAGMGHWQAAGRSFLFLAVALVLAGAVVALIASTVLPQAGFIVWLAAAMAVLLGLQLLVFRALGLRSRADREADGESESGTRGSDERAVGEGLHDGASAASGEAGSEAVSDEREHARTDRPGTASSTARAAEWRAWRG
jgi:hypothetical protein